MVKAIELPHGKCTLVDDEDYARFKDVPWRSMKSGHVVCWAKDYARDGQRIYLHREIMEPEAHEEVDHVNGDPLDNRRANLRPCSHAENMRNRRTRNKPSGLVRGVYAKEGRFYASLTLDGRAHHVGGYRTELEASVAYDQLAKHLHGEFASLNFSRERDWILPVVEIDLAKVRSRASAIGGNK